MFDLRQLRYFVAVAETLSFTQAARRLHMSQPPLSQQIQALEQDLGVTLLDRNKRRVALTEPGRLFLEEARDILAHADGARARVADAAAGYTGRLRLAYPASVAFHPALPQTLLRFSSHAPSVQVELTEMYTEAQYTALAADDQIDAGLVRALPKHRQLEQNLRLIVLDHEPLLLAMPASHRLATRENPIALKEVADEAFVAQPRAHSTTLYDTLTRLAARAGFHPSIRQEARQVTALLALVSAGVGMALVPASLRAVQLSGVAMLALSDPGASQLLALACRADNRSPVLKRFVDTLEPLHGDAPKGLP
ncbi:LysR family transcriptional regulator [Oleiagrimonas sp. C23AA]|uniref:LysR family transcriptional regulator n=1 Tax=Oleiagrimonas sp. C23AA TaxID=2719047 RepID=UPI001421324E|nr:LysR family transcriptional regulator [Oleiagrimonas sp. C23AA]NII09402.1 LysR family transcriptional regulator [Oleiagrimonas sp. C23AA]